MNDKENHIIYTAQDINQYLEGKLTPLQMHAMEKAALDDPFLAEAMEGYEGMKQEDWENELAALKNQFEHKEAKVIAMTQRPRKNNWWKIAAAVLLIGSITAVSYILLNKKDKQDLAKTEKTVPPPPATNATAEVPVKKDTDAITPLTQETAAVKPEVKPNNTAANKLKLPGAGEYDVVAKLERKKNILPGNGTATNSVNLKLYDSSFVYTPNKQKVNADAKQYYWKSRGDDADVVKDKNNLAVVTTPAPPPPSAINNNNFSGVYNFEKQAEESKLKKFNSNAATNNVTTYGLSAPQDFRARANDKNNAIGNFKSEPQLNRNFIAQVVGADNTPLPFANISIKSENFGTYADAKGNFRLVSSDSLLTVEVKAAGYQPRFYTLQSYVQQNKIVLAEEDATARYKTISANNTTAKARVSRRATLLKDSLVNVEPVDGWDNYNTYVDNNIEIPDDILKKDIHGQVELSFDVRANGTITNIKVDKSLCDNCDELAKRLIEQGPQWKVKKGKKGKGKVTVQF